jgi:hypothetical protein
MKEVFGILILCNKNFNFIYVEVLFEYKFSARFMLRKENQIF